ARPESEECMIARDIALALRTGAKVSFQHVSSANSVRLIRAGKALGADIYAEVTPHHISLTEDAVLTHGTNARMNPPLRREEDRFALIEGLADGTVDMIATDHAPHTAADKAKDFAHAPSGIIGLETAFSVCNTYLVRPGHLTRMELLRRMSRSPAEVYGLFGKSIEVGNRAELVLTDWDAQIKYKAYQSKSYNSPYTNMPLWGAVRTTVMGDWVVSERKPGH
ncbi:MAG: amidohydrolase family protein, partial [Intestinibacillus sp.]